MGTVKCLALLPVLVLTSCFGSGNCETENEQMKAMLARDREYAKEKQRKMMEKIAEDAKSLNRWP